MYTVKTSSIASHAQSHSHPSNPYLSPASINWYTNRARLITGSSFPEVTRACIQNKEMRERVDSMRRTLFNSIHEHSLGGLGQIHWLFASRLFLYSFLGFSVHTKRLESTLLFFVVTISIKNRLFLKNPLKPVYRSCTALFYRKRLPQQNGDRRIRRKRNLHAFDCMWVKGGCSRPPLSPHAIRGGPVYYNCPPPIVHSHGPKSVIFRKSG